MFKYRDSYPCVLIGRLGVDKKYRGIRPLSVGVQMMNFIKGWFIEGNKTGCKFILVDADNAKEVLKYYTENGFLFLFSNENSEANKYRKKAPLKTRMMFFDLHTLIQ